MHVTTVSLALRNSPRLPLATREKLQALALELGYRPDPDLSALVAYRRTARDQKRVAALAYVTHSGSRFAWKQAPAHARFFAGASNRAPQLGYQLEHFWLGEPGLTPRRLNDIFFSRGITGLILASHWIGDSEPLAFDWSRLSAVKIDFLPTSPAIHNVTNDQRAIIQLAVRRATAAGYQRVGLVMPRWWDEIVNVGWSAGFLAEQARFPAADRIPILYYGEAAPNGPPNPGVPETELSGWLKRHRPEVLISYSDFVLPPLAALGVRIPRDIAYIDIFLNEFDGHTAGVRQNCERVGELAVEVVASQLQHHVYGIPQYQTSTLVDGTWCDGKTLPARR